MVTRYYLGSGYGPKEVLGNLRTIAPEVLGATAWRAWGLWQGQTELSTILEIIGSPPRDLADRLREHFDQDAVLRVETDSTYQIHARP